MTTPCTVGLGVLEHGALDRTVQMYGIDLRPGRAPQPSEKVVAGGCSGESLRGLGHATGSTVG